MDFGYHPSSLPSLKDSNKLTVRTWKNPMGWKITFSFCDDLFSGSMWVSGNCTGSSLVSTSKESIHQHVIKIIVCHPFMKHNFPNLGTRIVCTCRFAAWFFPFFGRPPSLTADFSGLELFSRVGSVGQSPIWRAWTDGLNTSISNDLPILFIYLDLPNV